VASPSRLSAAFQFGRRFRDDRPPPTLRLPTMAVGSGEARLARRFECWIGVITACAARRPIERRHRPLSTPTMRTTSSTCSALPSTSGGVRQGPETAIFTTRPLRDHEAEMAEEYAFISISGTSIAAIRFTSFSGNSITRSAPKGLPIRHSPTAIRPRAIFPHQLLAIRPRPQNRDDAALEVGGR